MQNARDSNQIARVRAMNSERGTDLMTDEELLTFAEKAAGINFDYVQNKAMGKPWNPLTDDGDALRLAMRLCLKIETARTFPLADRYAATSRAIVRAAAEIGKAMR